MAAKDVRPDAEAEFTDVDTSAGRIDVNLNAEDETEVVAHAEDSVEDTPWCVGYLC